MTLMLAMVVAAIITSGVERSRVRWQANREEAQKRAKQHADQKEKEAAEQKKQKQQQWWASVNKGPKGLLWWPYAAGWTVATLARGSVAAFHGAREGVPAGARQGARLGRTAAREGWTLRDTWREYQRQRAAEAEQNERAQARSTGRDNEHQDAERADTADQTSWGRDRTPPPGAACRDCGTGVAEDLVATRDGVFCDRCLGRRAAANAQTGGSASTSSNGTAVPPVMVACLGCGTQLTREAAQAAGGRCGDCHQRHQTRTPSSGTAGGDESDSSHRKEHPSMAATCYYCQGTAVTMDADGNLAGYRPDAPSVCPSCTAKHHPDVVKKAERQHLEWEIAQADRDERRDPEQERAAFERTQRELLNSSRSKASTSTTSSHAQRSRNGGSSMSQQMVPAGGVAPAEGASLESTLMELSTVADQLDRLRNSMDNLAGGLTANEVDADTITYVSQIQDQVQAAATAAVNGRDHVQHRHMAIADAHAAAGGSDNVATKGWYGA